jgi:hypothetical protein
VSTIGRILALVVLAALGAATGILGAFVHDVSYELLGIGLPVGLFLALALAAVGYLLAGWVLRNRLAVLAPGLGWLVPALAMAVPRPEGDLVVAANAAGYAFLLGGSVLIGLSLAMPYGSRSGGASRTMTEIR